MEQLSLIRQASAGWICESIMSDGVERTAKMKT